jgi:hypothetical protein
VEISAETRQPSRALLSIIGLHFTDLSEHIRSNVEATVIANRLPHCGAKYKVVRFEAPAAFDKYVTCLGCGGALETRERGFRLKYLRVKRPSPRKRRTKYRR